MHSPIASVHPSNALTYLSLGAGLAAVAAALNGSADGAGAYLAIAALADTFDGRFARLFARSHEQETLGMHLDSLSDALSFGLVPVTAMSILLTESTDVTVVWWLAAAFYTFAALTRLAFYNVTTANEGGNGFIGLPAPVAALLWSTAFLAPVDVRIGIAVAVATAVAMVAPLRIARPRGVGLLTFALWPIVLLAAHIARA
jgi:CDP-diacylglycerol--serine O-phosphatidyltransferase